ncbi:FtsX-like permease family protein [Adlercreutzia sp. ZJ154]|uniref:ABC transporter permease n=1 Tax=Adlercreutzia sp. ZJ154 TaxID=2709790 RepID=UPI0013EBA9A0|nr:FtsX-like permease family protein [Adlercreutzia sp. ZJ154]
MEPLRTLVLAGLKRDKKTFIGLGILVMLASFALTFTLCLSTDLTTRETAALQEANAGDAFATDFPTNLNSQAIDDIKALPEVESVLETPTFSVTVNFENAQGKTVANTTQSSEIFEAWGTGISYKMLEDNFDAYKTNPTPPRADEIYITPAIHILQNVNIGDFAVLTIGDKQVRLKIAGYFEDPQMGTPFMDTNRYLLAAETFNALHAEVSDIFNSATTRGESSIFARAHTAFPLTEINVYMTPAAQASGLTSQDLTRIIGENTTWGASATNLFSSQTLAGYALMVVNVATAILGVFACLLFAIALVICVHSVSASIREGYVDWGIIKALGVPAKTLRRTLALQYMVAALAGMVIGFVVGIAIEPLTWSAFMLLTGVLTQNASFPSTVLICLATLMVLMMATVFLKARKLSVISPLSALRSGHGDVRFSPRANCAINGSWLEASLAWRAIVAQKRSYIGLAACSLLLCAFITLIFGIGGALNTQDAVYKAFGLWESDLSVSLENDNLSFEDVNSAIEEVCPIKRVWEEAVTMININGESRTFVGLTDMSIFSDATVVSGRKPTQTNEALVGMSLASDMGLSVGDKLMLPDSTGAEKEYLVSGILSAMLNAGYGTILTYEGLEQLVSIEKANRGDSRQYQLVDPNKTDEVRTALEARFGEDISLEDTGIFRGSTNMVALIRSLFITMGYAMAAFAGVLACVAVALISNRMFTSERGDLGIYRALGFRVRALRISFALRFLSIALAGSALGTAITALGGSWLVSKLFGLFGVGNFAIALPWWQVILLPLALSLIFTISAYVSGNAIRQVDIRKLVVE